MVIVQSNRIESNRIGSNGIELGKHDINEHKNHVMANGVQWIFISLTSTIRKIPQGQRILAIATFICLLAQRFDSFRFDTYHMYKYICVFPIVGWSCDRFCR